MVDCAAVRARWLAERITQTTAQFKRQDTIRVHRCQFHQNQGHPNLILERTRLVLNVTLFHGHHELDDANRRVRHSGVSGRPEAHVEVQ
jgi:hypothetical protein